MYIKIDMFKKTLILIVCPLAIKKKSHRIHENLFSKLIL